MDDADISHISIPDSPVLESGLLSPDVTEQSKQSAHDKQLATLQNYLDSVPYDCESIQEMDEKLAQILSKIFLCAKSADWLTLTSWDGLLQCWLLMRYPISKSTRAKLVTLYYELCLVPGVEPRIIRSWVDMFSRLLSNKPGQKRKLKAADLQLSWQPLWRALQKELWPKSRIEEATRNVVNILLYLADQSKLYYPASEIPNMLNTFLPLLTKDSVLTMVPVLISFLPPTHISIYLPALFKIWEAFNSNVIDDRLLELAGDLAEEHVLGVARGEGGAEWKDVGIWSTDEWTMLMGKCLGSMDVPVGTTKGVSTTAAHADAMHDKQSLRIKKNTSRFNSLAKLIVYSMSVDGQVRSDSASLPERGSQQIGYLAGSKAMDSLDKLITSTESFFHPSNYGLWTLNLSSFLQRLTAEFCKRWKEEEEPTCKTPVMQRLTPAIRHAFVITLRTPTLLAMFAKDPISMGLAQGALRSMALLSPQLVMPELLARAYNGLEAINETHRTTAVLSMLSGVALPLVAERRWLGGQKNLVPLLEMCIPGIDLNDPTKTVCATMFICAAVQYIKIGDLSIHSQSAGVLGTDNGPSDDAMMDVVNEDLRLPDGVEVGAEDTPVLDRVEERALVRDSTAGFADWLVSLFRRVLALYENLPEEGGKKNTTGGKQEETMLKSIKSTLDVVCLHLSDSLFALVLRVVYDYATTNARSNAVRAFGQLVACLARAKPQETIDLFLPFCIAQIREELRHGSSSVRTTSTHAAVPSDTTLHWNLSILRGCLGYGGTALLPHKQTILDLLSLLIEKTKSERGYSSTGRLITRILHTLSCVYPLNSRFVNTDEWDTPEFDRNHNLHWGRLYDPKDVKIEWHVSSSDEVSFMLQVLDQVISPALDRIEGLLQTTSTWDNTARNDFCRYLHAVRCAWSGLPTLYEEGAKEVANPCLEETDSLELVVTHLNVKAGFTLTNSEDPRYRSAVAHRARYGRIIHQAAQTLRENSDGEDHIDAVLEVVKAIDVFLLEYGMTRSSFTSLQKNYALARDLNRMWVRQKENSRLVLLKRAQVYHSGRVYMHALYRRRSELDDALISDLVELSLSPYTRVRRHGQAVLHNVCGYYIRSTRFMLPTILDALTKGNDPDRMKGALYVLWNKSIAAYALSERALHGKYIVTLLECQHQEKPSIQKLVSNVHQDCLVNLTEEATQTDSSIENHRLTEALSALQTEFTISLFDKDISAEALRKAKARFDERDKNYRNTISAIIEIGRMPGTHWRYSQMATRFLLSLLRRNVPLSPDLAEIFVENTVSSHPTIRNYAQRGITKALAFVKMRTYSESKEQLWLEEWANPLQCTLSINNPNEFLRQLQGPILGSSDDSPVYVDKIPTGYLVWASSVKAYKFSEESNSQCIWENSSGTALQLVEKLMNERSYFSDLASLWAQETNARVGGSTDLTLRMENVAWIKTIAKMFQHRHLDAILAAIEPLWPDSDRFKQRAAAEFIAGLLRGSKHWPTATCSKLWSWFTERLGSIFTQMKPDTVGFWETLFSHQLLERDPRRNQPLIDWLLAMPLDFHGDSAFTMSKSLGLFGILVDSLGVRFDPLSDKYINLFFDNAYTGYAEIRSHIASDLSMMMNCQLHPSYSSVDAFLSACLEKRDPLRIRHSRYINRIHDFVALLPTWKQERLPPPRVNQSQYDKVGLTLLQWIWTVSHGPQACTIFPYVVPLLPEILGMSELNDSSDLQIYSSAVLHVLSAVTPPQEYVELVANSFVSTIKSSPSWRIRLHGLPILIVFFYRNLTNFSDDCVSRLMELVLTCLSDENVEVREMAAKVLSGLLRCSQRHSILPLKDRFVAQVRKAKLPLRQNPAYAESLRVLHSGILGLCALVESFPYSVEPWMPPLTEVLAPHSSDPPPISTTIRKCASEFKKTHQDTWHTDQQAFDEDQLQSLSNMLIGTSYYA